MQLPTKVRIYRTRGWGGGGEGDPADKIPLTQSRADCARNFFRLEGESKASREEDIEVVGFLHRLGATKPLVYVPGHSCSRKNTRATTKRPSTNTPPTSLELESARRQPQLWLG